MKFSGHNSFALNPSRTALKQGNSEPGAKLIDAMKRFGKRAKFEQLIKSNLDDSSRIAFRLTGDWDAAEELVQETMLRAVKNWDSFREQSQFKTWIYRILINAFRDQYRGRGKLEQCEDTATLESRDHNVSSQAEARELGDLVQRLIAQLPERQKEVLILITYESFTNQQVADTLGISVANVHSNLCAARKRLKRQLDGYLTL